jgi:hypothetical protein
MSTFTVTGSVNIDSLARLGSVAGLAWTRSTTTATVTQNNHGLASNDLINVTVTSDAAAITTGVKTITVVNANSYTFTCLNAGAASGTITAAHIDDFLINGGYLTVDQDSRYGLNSNTSGAMGDIVLSASLGGTIEFKADKVRIIPYDAGTGNVPTLGVTISAPGGASGKLISVMSALNAAPTASGAAMPATGFIKIKQWNDVAYADNEVLSGISATVNGTDRVGWLEIVGAESLTCTVNRLNTFKVTGAWFDLGTTDGNRATTYQIPSHGSLVYLPGVWVETAASSGVYEFYPCAGSLTATSANVATDEVRGRWCWISTAGLLRFGHDGTNSSGGFIPGSGRKIRIPNVFFVNCTQAALTANVLPNATPGTRYEFSTTGGGVIDISGASMCWYPNLLQPYSVTLTNVGIMTVLIASEVAAPISWSHVGIGQEAANSQFGLALSNSTAGGTIANCVWTRATLASSGHYVVTMSDISGFTFTANRIHALGGNRGNATTGAVTATRANSCTWTNTVVGGGRVLLTTCASNTFTTTTYYDHPATTTPTTNPMFLFDIASSCTNLTFDGVTFGGLTLVQPYSGILNVGAAGCSNIKLRNLGTFASPLNMGAARQDGVAWSRTTTTATATKTAHGLKVNDIVYCLISSDTAAITVGAKTVASVPTADTFTFTCLNAGAASGTLTYYPTMAASLIVLANSAAASNVKVQRCYATNLRSVLRTGDNSSKGILFESVCGDPLQALLTPELELTTRNVCCTPALTAQTACYGTHWFDHYIHETVPNQSAVSWSRVTTTATVTSTDHGMRTGMLINVTVSSSVSAITLGQKTITVLTKDTFTFTCLNAGSASGTLSFVPFSGRIAILMNESTTATASQYTITDSGPVFTSAGGLVMPNVGDQIEFLMPSFLKGHSAFPIAEAVMAGGTITNYDLAYQIDQGSGFSAWKNLQYLRAGGGGANGSTDVTMTSTTGVAVGDYVWGTNIAPNAKVTSITNGTTVVVDTPNIGTVSGTLRFNQLPSETVTDAVATGFRLKVRITTATASTSAITSLYVITDSTSAARAATYPLDTATLTLTGLQSGSDVVVLTAGTETVLASRDGGGSTYAFAYEGTPTVDIAVYKEGYIPLFVRALALTSSDSTLPVSQVVDRAYLV